MALPVRIESMWDMPPMGSKFVSHSGGMADPTERGSKVDVGKEEWGRNHLDTIAVRGRNCWRASEWCVVWREGTVLRSVFQRMASMLPAGSLVRAQ